MVDVVRAPERTSRTCFECNFCYLGEIHCPKCGQPAGEPLAQGAEGLAADMVADACDEAILWTGLNEAVIGYAYRCGQPPVALYDRERCIEVLMASGPSTREEAEEYFEFNVAGAWVGDLTPLIGVLAE